MEYRTVITKVAREGEEPTDEEIEAAVEPIAAAADGFVRDSGAIIIPAVGGRSAAEVEAEVAAAFAAAGITYGHIVVTAA